MAINLIKYYKKINNLKAQAYVEYNTLNSGVNTQNKRPNSITISKTPKSSNLIFSSTKILIYLNQNLCNIIGKKIGLFDTEKNVKNFLYGMQSISEVKNYRNLNNYYKEKFPHIVIVNLD
jgi:transposase-like protein